MGWCTGPCMRGCRAACGQRVTGRAARDPPGGGGARGGGDGGGRRRGARAPPGAGGSEGGRAEAERAEAEGTGAGDRLAGGSALYTLARLDICGRRNMMAGKEAMERALAVLGDEPQATDLALQLMTHPGLLLTGLGLTAAAAPMFAPVPARAARAPPPPPRAARPCT